MAEMNNKFTKGILIAFMVLFMFLFALSLSGGNPLNFMRALGAQFLFAVFSYLIYFTYKDAYPIFKKGKIAFSILAGIGIGIGYTILSRLIPGLSIGVTLIPSSVSSAMSSFVINIVSPIMETILFFGAMLIILKKTNLGKKHPILTLIIIGLFASFIHVGAYVLGIADLPFNSAISAFSGNIGAFISAFIFFTLSGVLIVWKKTQSLLIGIIVHFIPNFSYWAGYSVSVVVNFLPLIH